MTKNLKSNKYAVIEFDSTDDGSQALFFVYTFNTEELAQAYFETMHSPGVVVPVTPNPRY